MRRFLSAIRVLSIAGAACVSMVYVAQASRTIVPHLYLPTLYLHSHQVNTRSSEISGKYFGQTATLPGVWPGAVSIAYDQDSSNFYVLVAGGFESDSSLYRVTRAGNAYLLTSDLDPNSVAVAYNASTKLLYATGLYDVYSVSPTSGIVSIIAGGTYGTKDGQGSAAQFQQPQGVVSNPSTGNVYVTDLDRIRQITPSGTVTTLTVPGNIGPMNGNFANVPEGLTFDGADNTLVVGDPYRDALESVTLSGTVSTLAGKCILPQFSNQCLSLQRDGPALSSFFDQPSGVVYDARDGSVEIADWGNQQVRRLYQGAVSTVAGNGHVGASDGIGAAISFNGLRSLAIDGHTGNLWVDDFSNGLLRLVSLNGSAPPPPRHGVQLFDPPTVDSGVLGIAALSDGSIWFTENAANQIGEITSTGSMIEYKLPQSAISPQRIAAGSDGNLWFADVAVTRTGNLPGIGKITSSGVVTEFSLPMSSNTVASDVELGPDGNVWFLGGSYIGYITPAGAIQEYPAVNGVRLTGGYDGAVWASLATSSFTGVINRYSTMGQLLSQYSFSSYNAGPLTKGPGVHIWFSQADAVGYATKSSLIEFLLPSCGCSSHGVSDIVGGADNAVWFTEAGTGYIGRMTPSAAYIGVIIPEPRSAPQSITVAPNGSIWFTDPGADRIGRAY